MAVRVMAAHTPANIITPAEHIRRLSAEMVSLATKLLEENTKLRHQAFHQGKQLVEALDKAYDLEKKLRGQEQIIEELQSLQRNASAR